MKTMQTAIFSLTALRQLEKRAEQTSVELMPRAARAIVSWVQAHYPSTASILLVAGPGNNGGDAIIAAKLLLEANYPVHLLLTRPPRHHLAQQALSLLQQQGVVSQQDTWPDLHLCPDLLIDGLFGIGIDRPLGEPWSTLIDRMNHLGVPILALDTPSGLDAYKGSIQNSVIQASNTITFLCHKPGLLTGDGADYAGTISLATLDHPGWQASAAEGELNQPSAQLLARQKNSHKGSYGCVVIAGGAEGMLGAALLAGRAALYCGAGKVYVCTLDQRLPADPGAPELMLCSADTLPVCTVLAIGPGLGQGPAARKLLADALERAEQLILDADALNILAGTPALQTRLAQRSHPGIVTPHPAEAARLLGVTVAMVQADRVNAARALALRLNSIVVLKGAGSLIMRPDGYYRINTSGGPALSSAGQGDTLTGLTAALLAQGLAPFDAASLAVHVHGLAADQYEQEHQGPIGLTASQTAKDCADILNRLLMQENASTSSKKSR